MKIGLRTFFYASILFLTLTEGLFAQAKYALVIGVKSYQHVAPLRNSLNDAQDMSSILKKKGFTVVDIFEPATKRIMQEGIIRYFKLLEGKPDAVGLVFYSGHGMQVKGTNYLIPTQANPQIEADLDDQCVNMEYVMRAIQQAGNGLNIFILDACRNNPFRSFSRSGEKGLSMVDTPQGSYIVYATKPGSVASDGTGRNGLFTSKLLQYINSEGLNIEQVFKQVARDVAADSGNEQRPWIASDYTGDFFFTPGKPTALTQSVSTTKKETETKSAEMLMEKGFRFPDQVHQVATIRGTNGACKIESFIGAESQSDDHAYTVLKINQSEYQGGQCINGFLNGLVLISVNGDQKKYKQNMLAYFVNGRITYPVLTTSVDDTDQLFIGINEGKKSYGCLNSGSKYNWNAVNSRPMCVQMKEIYGEEIFSSDFVSGFKAGNINLKELETKFDDFFNSGKKIIQQ